MYSRRNKNNKKQQRNFWTMNSCYDLKKRKTKMMQSYVECMYVVWIIMHKLFVIFHLQKLFYILFSTINQCILYFWEIIIKNENETECFHHIWVVNICIIENMCMFSSLWNGLKWFFILRLHKERDQFMHFQNNTQINEMRWDEEEGCIVL